MTFKSFLLLYEASLTISTRAFILLQGTSASSQAHVICAECSAEDVDTCACKDRRHIAATEKDSVVQFRKSLSYFFGTQLGPLCIATVTAMSLLSLQAQVSTSAQIASACDDILLRILDSFFPVTNTHSSSSEDSDIYVLKQRCVQKGVELVIPNCPILAAAVQSGGFSALLGSASSDSDPTVETNKATLIRSGAPLLAAHRLVELLALGLDTISASAIKQFQLFGSNTTTDLLSVATATSNTMSMSMYTSFCQVQYHCSRQVWLPLVQFLLSYHDVIYRETLMPIVFNLMEKLVSTLTPHVGMLHSATTIDSNADSNLVVLLTDTLPTLAYSIVSTSLWQSPDSLRVATSVIK